MIFDQELSKEIFEEKYMHQKRDKEIGVSGVFREIANTVSMCEHPSDSEYWSDVFYNAINDGILMPSGRILSNARSYSNIKNYNNCYTIGINDSMEEIFESLKEDALISKVGGGVGFDISNVRPRGSELSNGGKSAGVISFMKIFNESAKAISTGGNRKSAHIALLDISHPDVEEFIVCKQGDNNKQLTQFNISVKITDRFMEAVKNDEDWQLVFDGKIFKTLKAKELYDNLLKNAYTNNEPGIFFVDQVNKYNNGYYDFRIDSVNPCGEIPMPEYSLCCLSALNLVKFVNNPFTDNACFDFELFSRYISIGVRFLDNVLDVTEYPLKKIEELSKRYRRVGLGITGLGNVFTMLGMKYGDKRSKELSGAIGKCLRDSSYLESSYLALQKGRFDGYKEDILNSEFLINIKNDNKILYDKICKTGLRNIGLNTIAPTGTTSLSIGNNCSSGIEPAFMLEYNRNIRTDGENIRTEKVMDYAYKLYVEKYGADNIPDYFTSISDISVYDQIDIQSIMHKYIDHSISKTANLKSGTTFEEYKKIFTYAYESGLKGFTTFNPDGSMKGIVEYNEEKDKKDNTRISKIRPDILKCDVYKYRINGENWVVFVGVEDGKPYELFAGKYVDVDILNNSNLFIRKKNKKYELLMDDVVLVENIPTYFENNIYEAITRLVSTGLRHDVPISFLVEQLSKAKGDLISFEKSISRSLKKYILNNTKSTINCHVCGEKLIFKDGCKVCISCGWTACD